MAATLRSKSTAGKYKYRGDEQLRNKTQDICATFSPEFKLLFTCLRGRVGEKERELLDAVTVEGINWDFFMGLAVHHGIYPLVYQYLSTLDNAVLPLAVVCSLREKFRENMSKSLQMTGELVKLIQLMEQNGIRVLVLKGFLLGHKLYGNVALRPAHDLDILVWPEEVDKASKIIEAQDYERIFPGCTGTPKQLRNWMKTQHHFSYWQKDKQISLELHWRLGHHGLDIPLTCVKICQIQVQIAKQSMSILGAEELLLSLALHGASHGWFRLKWLCDIGMILRQAEFSWQKLYRLTRSLGFESVLNQTIVLVHELLAVQVPDNIADTVFKDLQARKLADMTIPFITKHYHRNTGVSLYYWQKKYELNLRYGWRRKLSFIHGHFLPTDADIELIALPAYFYFIYYLLRPFTWLGRKVWKFAPKQC